MSEMVQRSVLPIPRRTRPGLTTYDAKDPDTHGPDDLLGRRSRRCRPGDGNDGQRPAHARGGVVTVKSLSSLRHSLVFLT